MRHSIRNSALLLAVSGGSDSVALFQCIILLRKQLNLTELGVAHINHGLRPDDAVRETAFVRQLAEKNRCSFHYAELSGKNAHDPGVELWARNERYRFFASLQQQHGYQFVATGHTADDQAETMLMRITRGSGSLGLCGIHPVRKDGVIRPLLTLRRIALRNWLKEQGCTWCEDHSNNELYYMRNRIRHGILRELIKHETGTVENLAVYAHYLQEQRAFLAPLVQRWIDDNLLFRKSTGFALAREGLQRDRFLVSEGIAQLFREYSISFDRGTIERLYVSIERTSGAFLLKDGWRFYPGNDRIEFMLHTNAKSSAAHSGTFPLHVSSSIQTDDGWELTLAEYAHAFRDIRYDPLNWTVYLDGEQTGTTLLFRAIDKTDFFQPLGSSKPVNCFHYLKKQRISSYFRETQGVIADTTGRLVWIPGIAVAHHCRISEQTKKIFQFSCRRISSNASI